VPSYLHRRLPSVDLPRVALGSGPTPVRRLEEDQWGLSVETWMKDDGAYGDGPWGGNKVRKLEWIIPEAHRRGVRSVLSVGGIGTHWGLALATYGAEHGLRTVLGLVDQPVDDHVTEQLRRLQASGALLHRFRGPTTLRLGAPYLFVRGVRGRRLPWYLPPGGSNPHGALGYVEAALEIAAQVQTGELPEPGTILVPVGSGGTVAGLALGLRLAGLHSRLLGVVVNDALPLDERAMARLANRTGGLLRSRGASGVPAVTAAGLETRSDWLGRCYGDPTPAAVRAVEDAAERGLTLEPVYTGKTLAALRDLGPKLRGPVLWIQTHGPR
jgi:D-cysteine desulfhydrase